MFTRDCTDYLMTRCIDAALRGSQSGLNKPFVGALIATPDGDILGEGYRVLQRSTRTIHAERRAIERVERCYSRRDVSDGILVTTLEPCVEKYRRQPLWSCTELIVHSGIKKVVFGVLDTSELMDGGAGIRMLERSGLRVMQYDKLNDVIVGSLLPQAARKTYEQRVGRIRT